MMTFASIPVLKGIRIDVRHMQLAQARTRSITKDRKYPKSTSKAESHTKAPPDTAKIVLKNYFLKYSATLPCAQHCPYRSRTIRLIIPNQIETSLN